MSVLLNFSIEISDIELLSNEAEQSDRSSEPYVATYDRLSRPIKLPIPSEEQAQAEESPFVINEHAKVKRSPAKSPLKKSGKSRPLPEGLTAPQQTLLPLFGSANARAAPSLPPSAASTNINDVIFNVGGSVWSLDWCPVAPDESGSEAATQYLAVGVHAKDKKANVVGKPVTGCGLLQIWELQHRPEGNASKAAAPRLAMGLCHDHGVVWDAKWCPLTEAGDVSDTGQCLQRLGLLAVVYGDGEVQVLAVPHPEVLQLMGAAPTANGQGSKDPVLIRLRAKAAAPKCALDSFGSCIEWLPNEPHDLILVGCWDGTAVLWRIPPGQPSTSSGTGTSPVRELQLLTRILADTVPLRSVAWVPDPTVTKASDMAGRFIFMTAGHSSIIKIWDARDPFQPLLEVPAHIAWIMSAAWMRDPAGVLLCQDDGGLRWLSLNPYEKPGQEQKVQSNWWGVTTGALWSCHASPISGHTAYAGNSGQVVIACPSFQQKLRIRPPHIVISSTLHENEVICMTGQEAPQDTLGSRSNARKGEVTDPQAAIFRVRWGCAQADEPEGTWLASGGANGIVRCQRIAFYVFG